MSEPTRAILIYAASEPGSPQFSADLLWRTGFQAPDPVLYLECNGAKVLIVSQLEFGRATEEARVDTVLLFDALFDEAGERTMRAAVNVLIKRHGISEFTVPASFPFALGKKLETLVPLVPVQGSLFPERSIKTDLELTFITQAAEAVRDTLEEVRVLLGKATIVGDHIMHDGALLTSEILREYIDAHLYTLGYSARGTIVSSGYHAALPHSVGTGPLLAHQPIVMDIFPYSRSSHYFADITRTFIKGTPSGAVIHCYEAVRKAQTVCIAALKAGVDAADLQQLANKVFAEEGYLTGESGSVIEGFIHSLGHGVGLELHEDPHVGASSSILPMGTVITIEPGLYYPQGIPAHNLPPIGIRLEDMLVVTETGSRPIVEIPTDLGWACIP